MHPPKANASFLAQLDAAPPDQKWPLARSWIRTTPANFFAELRTSRPICVLKEVTLLARADDLIEVLRQPKTFSVGLYGQKMGNFMLGRDETIVNTRDKGIMLAALSRTDLPVIRQRVVELCAEILDSGATQIELVQDYARRVPVRVVKLVLGFDCDEDAMLSWSMANQDDQFNNQDFEGRPDSALVAQRAKDARREMIGALAPVFALRSQQIAAGTAPDDVITRIMKATRLGNIGWADERVGSNTGGLLIGTVETTMEAVCNVLDVLHARPAQLAAARALALAPAGASDPFDGYVFEALRFKPIAPFMFRLAEADHVLARGTPREIKITNGDIVLPLIQSAMFDPNWTPEPDAFDPKRSEYAYLHFGWGHHECMGKYLGAMLICEMVRQVLRRDWAPTGALDFGGTPFPQTWQFTLMQQER